MTKRELEKYYSPDWAVKCLRLGLPFEFECSDRIYEPCCGDGAISNPLKQMGYKVITNDIDPTVEADWHYDYSNPATNLAGKPDWIITNPPFSLALPMLVNALHEARTGVVFLLRLSFLEPTDKENKRTQYPRADFLEKRPPTGTIVTPRYSFTQDGRKDTATTAWFVWLNQPVRIGISSCWPTDRQFTKIISRKMLKAQS